MFTTVFLKCSVLKLFFKIRSHKRWTEYFENLIADEPAEPMSFDSYKRMEETNMEMEPPSME